MITLEKLLIKSGGPRRGLDRARATIFICLDLPRCPAVKILVRGPPPDARHHLHRGQIALLKKPTFHVHFERSHCCFRVFPYQLHTILIFLCENGHAR